MDTHSSVTGAPVCQHGYTLSHRTDDEGRPIHMGTGGACIPSTVDTDQLRTDLAATRETSPPAAWADGVACGHGTTKRDCEWCNPVDPATVDTDPLGRGTPPPADPQAAGTPGDRLRQIAAIHALAHFYACHPEIPMPDYVLAASTSLPSAEVPEHERVLEVMDFAKAVGTEAEEDWSRVHARHTLSLAGGMRVVVRMTAELDRTSGKKYVR